MANYEGEPPVPNLVDWRLGLEAIHHPLGRQLRENPDPYAVAASLGLPIPSYVKFGSPDEFLADTEAGLRPLKARGVANYYVGLRPLREDLPKYRNEEPLAHTEVAPYIRDHITPEHGKQYVLRIAEYVVAVCGAVVVINPSGSEHIDMVMGDLGPLATGRARPEYQAVTDQFTGVRRYYEAAAGVSQQKQLGEDHTIITPDIRTAIARGMSRIPRLGNGMRDPRTPGRYELAIVRHFNKLDPVFVDAQPDGPRTHPYALPETPLY
ncbi:MAG TPA: hypothetical protein VLG11_02335 [Candidatus Saccharimonadales bacterium]|nr:hypothetical protein [Candidatus Saccharimonadales bacterium]